jgi:hypothetical protein
MAGHYDAEGPKAEFEAGSRGRVLRTRLGIKSVQEIERKESESFLAATEQMIFRRQVLPFSSGRSRVLNSKARRTLLTALLYDFLRHPGSKDVAIPRDTQISGAAPLLPTPSAANRTGCRLLRRSAARGRTHGLCRSQRRSLVRD